MHREIVNKLRGLQGLDALVNEVLDLSAAELAQKADNPMNAVELPKALRCNITETLLIDPATMSNGEPVNRWAFAVWCQQNAQAPNLVAGKIWEPSHMEEVVDDQLLDGGAALQAVLRQLETELATGAPNTAVRRSPTVWRVLHAVARQKQLEHLAQTGAMIDVVMQLADEGMEQLRGRSLLRGHQPNEEQPMEVMGDMFATMGDMLGGPAMAAKKRERALKLGQNPPKGGGGGDQCVCS